MALRNQPYLPLYVQDFLTDEKLNECSAATTGVYIKLMCVLHKTEKYGKYILKKKLKKSTDKFENFSHVLQRHISFSQEDIKSALLELYEHGIIKITENELSQKRMVKDSKLSETRALAVKKRWDKKDENLNIQNEYKDDTNENTNCIQNAEYEYENEIEYEDNSISNSNNNDLSNTNVKDSKKKYGEYGWIKLTDKQYAKLNKDFGENVIAYYIAYIDEYVQGNKNKNKYSDWNLTIRKAIRDRWGNPPERQIQQDDMDGYQ